jgi:hypothetical protein
VSNDKEIEQMIQDKGKIAPRVTPDMVEAEIADELTLGPVAGVMTIVVLKLRNGFLVTGESACASPENFDAEIGHRIARGNAVQKIWGHLGFRLKDQLQAQAAQYVAADNL